MEEEEEEEGNHLVMNYEKIKGQLYTKISNCIVQARGLQTTVCETNLGS